MNVESELPGTICVEVKFTTATAIVASARELEALRTGHVSSAGLLAALFWCGDRDVDGRWLVVDARESLGLTSRSTQRWSKDELARLMEHQRWLSGVRSHLDRFWKPFLYAFYDEAMNGREALYDELMRCHAERTTSARLSGEPVLDAEHRDAMAALVKRQGEANAGHTFQVFFAYLLAHAGYRKVMINAVGVPDIIVSELQRADEEPRQLVHLGTFETDEIQRLARYCREAGDDMLAKRILACLPRSGALR